MHCNLPLCALNVLLTLAASSVWGAEKLTDEQAARLTALTRPQADESQWTKVPWLTNLDEARRLAIEKDRPLFIWRSGGGDVLGRT
jgi:hypothetical protein